MAISSNAGALQGAECQVHTCAAQAAGRALGGRGLEVILSGRGYSAKTENNDFG